MPQKPRGPLPPLKLASREPLGERIRRRRKECGLTQVQLAAKIGIVQNLVSNYESGRLRLNADMLTRFALALDISADELLGIVASRSAAATPQAAAPSLALLRRLALIEKLPQPQRRALLKTIDTFIKGAIGEVAA